MKKILTKIFLFAVLAIAILQLKTYAATLEETPIAENTVSLSITSETDILNALSATFQIEGDVTLEKFEWNASLNNIVKSYEYHKETNSIIIYITPQVAINLNQNGKIEIGTITVTGSQKANYIVKLKELNPVGATYRIQEETTIVNPTQEFEYVPEVKEVASFATTLATTKTQFIPGEEFELTIKVGNFTNFEKGLIAFSGQLEYNYDILERIGIEGQNDWNLDGNSFNESNFKFIIDANNFLETEQTICKIKFKVKESIVVPRDATIKVKNITGTNASIDITSKDAEKTIRIEERTPEDSITSTVYQIEDNNITRILPETKISDFKNNVTINGNLVITDTNGNILGDNDILATGMKIKVGSLEYIAVVTGDINGDGKIGLTDFAKLKLHYIDYEILTGVQLKAADIDGNGTVTLLDIAQIKLILIGKMELK